MDRSLRLTCAAAAVAAGLTLAAAPARAATLAIDNFEEYTPGSEIGTSFTSKPYIAGGNVDAFYADDSSTNVLDGTESGVLGLGRMFSTSTRNFAIVAFNNFSSAGVSNNLSAFDTFSVLTRSLSTTGTTTAQLQLYISDESTSATGATYVSDAIVSESTTAETATFSLSGTFTLTDANGSTRDSVATVLGNLGSIGLQITDPTNSALAATGAPAEQFAFDDLTASTAAVPEPTSIALLGLAAVPLGLVRRRRA